MIHAADGNISQCPLIAVTRHTHIVGELRQEQHVLQVPPYQASLPATQWTRIPLAFFFLCRVPAPYASEHEIGWQCHGCVGFSIVPHIFTERPLSLLPVCSESKATACIAQFELPPRQRIEWRMADDLGQRTFSPLGNLTKNKVSHGCRREIAPIHRDRQ
jgi:hypothetical protein